MTSERLPDAAFRRLDETPDEEFYRRPRLVQHIDERAIEAVTNIYRRWLPPGGTILDLCSSWVSHLPPEIQYGRVVGIGLNAAELEENAFLDEWRVQNLNTDPRLPFADGEFDAATCCVSVQYLTRPIELLREVGRVLRPGAPLVLTFSDRCFATKAIACWRMLDDDGHLALIGHYLHQAGNWSGTRCCACRGKDDNDPLYAIIAFSEGPATAGSAD